MASITGISANVVTPHSGKSRLVFGLLWFAVIVVVALFSGTLTSYLAVSVTRLPYSTLQQVVNASDYRIRISTQSVFAKMFKVRGGNVVGESGDWCHDDAIKLGPNEFLTIKY